MAAKLNLLESDGEQEEEVPQFHFNEEYAKRLEHNRKREDLHRLQELKKRGLVESSDSEEDVEEDEDGIFSKKTEVRIYDTLARIKNRDPSIYKSDVNFFDEEEEDSEDDEQNRKALQRKKSVYLKDVVAQQALEGNPDDEDDEAGGSKRRTFKTYSEEQQEIKDEILKGVAEASAAIADDDDLFKVRKKSKEEMEEEKASESNDNIKQRLDDYFGNDNELDENDKFLKDYLLNQGWIDKNKDKLPSYEDIVGEVSEEEAELDKQDDYEARYNFRFEEEAGSQVLGHSRHVENSVRKLPDKRKEQRKAKQARVQEEELARQEEVKRLKNVKKKEIMEKMSKIKSISGVTDMEKFDEKDLEDEFDPATYDKKMQEVFGDEYYTKDDPDANFQSDIDEDGPTKPDFDAEDEALGLPQGWDKPKDGFAAFHEKQTASNEDSDEATELAEEVKRKLEEYYRLDYEDVVGGMPTRFKYTQVKPNTFGLSTAHILGADDSELNQYISLKALAPYQTEEWIPRHKHIRLTKKERKKRALDQVPQVHSVKIRKVEEKTEPSWEPGEQKPEGEKRKQEKKTTFEPEAMEQLAQRQKVEKKTEPGTEQKPEGQKKRESTAEDNEVKAREGEKQVGEETGKKKRKRRKQGLNMSQSRLLAYGKIDLPKKKKKH